MFTYIKDLEKKLQISQALISWINWHQIIKHKGLESGNFLFLNILQANFVLQLKIRLE